MLGVKNILEINGLKMTFKDTVQRYGLWLWFKIMA
jgi:hypothetical protein